MECNTNRPKQSQTNEADAEPSSKETRGTNPKKKGHIDYQVKGVREHHHQKYIHSKILIPEKIVIPTISEIEIDTTASSPSNPSFVFTPNNSKFQIHKQTRNTTLTTGVSMISGIDEKGLLKKYPVKVRPFSGASANDMHRHL